MAKTFTRPFPFIIPVFLLWLIQLVSIQHLQAQANQTTPTFNVDLTGDANGTWTSEEVTRNGQLCGASTNDNCVQFNITLSPNSGGLQFVILSGPEPSGSMGYQLECGSQQPVGQPICVNGVGPHKLTLCMPGNAKGRFQIKSIAAFYPAEDISVTKGCTGVLQAPTAFREETITWKDITGNGLYDKYLSFPNGKAKPVVTPDANAPAYVDYQVCGASQTSQCATLPYCDVVRVFFYAAPVVTIGPQPAIICPGSSGVLLVGNVTGGNGTFSYIWTDNNGNQVATTKDYTATAVGTYHLEVRNGNYPNCQKFSSSITVVNNLAVNAGPDQRVCSLNDVTLTGSVTGATGGIWSGGAGTFVSGNTSLNNVYKPTAAELQQGFVKLTLTSTGNGSCSPQKDEVIITFYTVEASITGPAVICTGSTASLTANANGAETPTFTWSSGETTATITGKPAGTYSVVIRDINGCTVTKSFTVTEVAGPTGLAASTKGTTCGSSNGEIAITGVTGGTSPYTYSLSGPGLAATPFGSTTNFTALAAGAYTVTVQDAKGCIFTRAITLTNTPGPTAVVATATQAASCKNNDGSLAVGTVTGGTAPYTYAIDGTNFQTSTTFAGLAAQDYTVTAKDANGCLITTSVTIVRDIPVSFTSSTIAATCGSSNGQINITSVTGGKAPYTYSRNLINYQTSATFTGLSAASYTITIKDANGCVISGTVQVNNISGTTDLIASVKATTCGDSNGELAITGVTGGTAPFTYSLNSNPFQTNATFTNIAAAAYQVHVKDANGCIFTKEVTVPNIAGPGFTATTQASTCGNINGSITISTVTGGTAPFSYSKDGTNFQTGTTFTALAAGNYTITVKDANGCLSTKAITLNNIAGPTDLNLTAAASTCGSSNGSITVGGVTGGTAPYTYTINGSSFQTSTSFTALAAAEYTVAVQDANGCTFSKKITVNNVAGPSELAASLKSTTCGSSNGELTVTGVTSGTAPYTYSKDGVTFKASAIFSGLAAGDYAITVKDNNGCTFVRTFTLNNIPGPTAVAATATQAASCKNNDGSLAVGTVTGGTAPYTYAIDGTNFQTSTTFAGLAAGNYTITAKDANGCLISTSVTITTNVPTSFASSTTSSTCGSSNGALTVTGVTGGTAPYTYSRNNAAFQASATFSGLSAGGYIITVKDANGCTFAATVQVNNITGPADLTASVQTSTCGLNNGSFTINNITGGTAPYTYSKDGTSFQASATFTNLLADTYAVSVKDANGCIYTEEVTVPNIAGPAFTATSQASTCGNSNGSITISTVTGGTAPFSYSKDGTNFQTQNTFTALAAGNYTITTKDANGCTASQAVTLNNIAGPTDLNLTAAASTCGSSNGSITVGAVTGGTAPYTYSKDGINFQATTTFAALLAGEHTITVKDANGCLTSKKINISDVAGPAALEASLKSTTCGSSNGELTVTGVTGGTAPYTYSIDGGSFANLTTFTSLAAGNHIITVKDNNGCTFVRTFTLNNIPGPTAVAATATQAASCKNNDGSLAVGTVTGGTAPYTYAIDGTNFQTSTTFAGLAAGNYTITAKDANGCLISTSVTITTNVPTSFASSTTSSTCGSSNGALTVTGVTGGTAPYTYSRNNAAFQASATFSGLSAGGYIITVKDANGCTFAATVQVNDIPGPTDLAIVSQSSTCSYKNGEITISGVTGGTAPYTYAIDAAAFQSANNFTALLAGTYTLRVKDANGCVYTEEVEVNNIAGSTFTATAQASTCGNPNGSISISQVTGGTAPYTYSKDNSTFQTGTTFSGLMAGNYAITIKDANGCLSTQTVTLNNIPGPTALTLTSTASSCGRHNGLLEVTGVTGGTAPYTYAINSNFQTGSTFENLLAGEYTVTVKDANGCTVAKTITVNDVAGPADLTASLTSSTCGASNGVLTLTGVTGGTSPYTYSQDGVNFQVSATLSALAAGQHAITVKDANGCTFVKTFTLNNISGPTAVAASSQPATCADNDGTITAGTVSGGTAPYTYALNEGSFRTSTSFTGMASGIYTLTVKDANNCTVTTSVTVGKNVPTSFTSTSTASTCGDSNGQFSITGVTGGSAPYTYSLVGGNFSTSATFTALAAGTYQVIVKDANNCSYTGTVQVNNVAGPTFTATAQATTCGNANGSISISAVTGGTAPYTYSKDGTTFQSATTFNGLTAGSYTIVIKDANACQSSQVVQVQDIAGPSTFALTSTPETCGDRNGSITIGPVTGGTVPFTYALNNASFQNTASFNGVAAGEHTLTVKDANGCTAVQKVIIQNFSGPADLIAGNISSTCGNSNGKLEVTGVTGGTAPYLFSRNGSSFQSSAVFSDLAAGTHTLTVKDANGCTYAKSFTLNNIAGPTAVAASSVPATCLDNDGSITVGAVTGGTAPYAYALDGTAYQTELLFAGLATGTYTLRAKDANGCIVTQQIAIGKNIPTSFTHTTVSSTCGKNDGQITVTGVTGGTAPYTYSIGGTAYQSATSFTGLAAGSHAVTIKDAKGCSYTGQVQVNDQGGPTDLAAAVKATTCGASNGEINITSVSGGTAPYAYSLDGLTYQNANIFTALTAGKYQVNIKDANGCIYTKEVIIIDLAAPTFTATAQSSTCGNSNASITVSGITGGTAPFRFSRDGVNFQSETTFTGLAAGTYVITVKDGNGCLRTVSVTIENIPGPTGFSLAALASTCGSSNGKITVSAVEGGTGPFTYAIDGTNFQASPAFEAVLAGAYTVTVKDANGCTETKKITVTDIAGPAGLAASLKASTCGSSNGELTLTGVTGGTAPYTYSQDGVIFQASATFTGLAAKDYAITVKDANGCTFVRTFILNNIAGPTAVSAATQPASCANNDGTITAGTVSGGTAPYTYAITGRDYQSSTTFTGVAAGTYTLTAKDANNCMVTSSVTVGTNVPTSFTSTTVSAACGSNNGGLTVTGVTGGTAPYTYSQDGTVFQAAATFPGLTAGSYTITVKDAKGCTYAGQVQVNNNAGPTDLTASVNATTCGNENGQITISGVTGGTAPYTYALDAAPYKSSGTFSALAPGTYTLAVKDANGCVYTEEVEVKEILNSTFTLAARASTCGNSNGSIAINDVTGGSAPYTYSKDGTNFQTTATFSGLAAGSYTIIVKDASGCLTNQAVILNNIPGPTALAFTTKGTTCGNYNGELEITGVTGGTAPYTYSINGNNFQPGATFTALLAGEYTVTVQDANGCTVSKKGVITDVAGPADLAAALKAATCGSSNGEVTVTGVTGGTAPYTYRLGNSTYQVSATFTALPAGRHEITVKDANGCTVVKTFTLDNQGGPTALTANTQAASCANNDGRISISNVAGGTAPYTYSVDGSQFQAGNTFSGLASGAYTVTVKDASGCIVSEQVQVDKNIPTSFTHTSTAATCGENNGQFSITAVAGGTAPYTYSIGGTAYQSAATFTGLASAKYQVNVKDANGCVFTGQVQVDIIQAPTFTATAQPETCGSKNGSISLGEITGGKAPYAYSKDGTNYQPANVFYNLAAGTYTITLRDANGCLHSTSVKVEVLTGPTDFTLTATATTCGESNGQISFGPVTGGTAPYKYSINVNTLNDDTFQSSPDFKAVAAGTYTATVKDANGCILKKEVIVGNIAGLTNLRATVFPSACSTNNGSILVDAVSGGTTPYRYSLDGVTYQASGYFAELAPKAYTVYVRDANGCSTSTQVTVITNGPQNALITATPSGCTNKSGTITIGSVTGGTQPYTYSLNGSTYQASATFENLAGGSYTITIRDAGGCTLTRTQEVGGTGGATAFTANTTDANCSGTNGQVVISNISGGKSPYIYSINGTTFQTSATFDNLAAGTYQVSVKDAGGCLYSQAVTVNGSDPLANLQVAVTPAGCGPNGGQVVAQQVTGGTGSYTYSLDGVNFSTAATFTGVLPGKYTLTVKDTGNCSLTAAVEVTSVSSTLAQVKDVSCFGAADGEITIVATGTTDQTEYSIDNGLTFHKQAKFSNLAAGVYQVITRFSATCAITLGKAEVKGPAEIRATVTPLTKTLGLDNTGSAAITTIEGGVKPYSYQLDNGTSTQNPEFKNLTGGVHKVSIKDANGCTTQVSFTIESSNDVEIPNGFTPNGDGINDTWAIKNLSLLYPKCKVQVFNRWGTLVFESVGYTWEWDGTYNTRKLPDGTYYCIIQLDDKQPVLRKSVTIMR